MHQPDEERRLVNACLSGERGAWDTFVETYSPFLYSVVCKTLRNRTGTVREEQAAELFSDVFYEIFRNDFQSLQAFSGRSKLTTYLYVIARRRCAASMRPGKGKTEEEDAARNAPWEGLSPEQAASSQERTARVRQALASLPERDGRALELFYFKGLSYSMLAELLGVPIEHVGMILKRARERLEKVLGKGGESLL
jgi:RNA polymerase sigma-70 factor (ECF subfamily)